MWRIIVVEEWPIARDVENADNIDASGKMDKYVINPGNYAPNHGDIKPPARVPAAYRQVAKRYSDWFRNWKAIPRPLTLLASHREFDQAIRISIRISTVTFFLKKWKGPKAADAIPEINFNFNTRTWSAEFYFTTDKSLDLGGRRTGIIPGTNSSCEFRIGRSTSHSQAHQRSVFQTLFRRNGSFPMIKRGTLPPEFAPHLPGRYGVIGSAGAKYYSGKQEYMTTIGRIVSGLDTTDR